MTYSQTLHRPVSLLLLALVLCMSAGCQSVYYKAWEKLGVEKRDLLQDHVTKVKREQGHLQEEFKDTLERIRHEYDFKAGKLESIYDRMSADYEDIQSRKKDIDSRIDKITTIAGDLFKEWDKEAKTMKNADLRRDSQKKLAHAKKKFAGLKAALGRTQARVKPVLAKMRDHVLYLKHNLNAKAMNVFKKEVNSIQKDIESLIRTIEESMKVSEDFNQAIS